MNLKTIASPLIAMLLMAAVPGSAQIATKVTKNDFEQRKKEINAPRYFSVFDRNLTPEQREALEVLYAYMPLPDLTDYSGDYFLRNVDYSLKAREEMPWGKTVPAREFRHFVLPVRINNENLDDHRAVIYEELKDRVKGMSMKDAILEINHWCHEKATYQPSDSRTHAPLATMYTSIGRCGEESTFTVGALRAMGIPARQVYTPRWAHTDDNHAWVEAWADGQWYFLGACEPEAVLNLGWFNAPASRGVLMNTRAIGRYDGPEEHLLETPMYTDINVTSNYAPIESIAVTVTDKNGNPAKDAQVTYRVYNYGEFYPIVTKRTDAAGRSSLSTGLGDITIWASDGKNYGFRKASVGKEKEVTVVMDRDNTTNDVVEFNIVPPVPGDNSVSVDPAAAAVNERRMAQEDSIRGLYTATFLNPAQAAEWAEKLGTDKDLTVKILVSSRGNHQVLTQFLSETPVADRDRALRLIDAISTKDKSDVPLEILRDHLTAPVIDIDLYDRYVLSPRVDNEMLTAYRTYFTKKIPAKDIEAYRADPRKWVEWVAKNIDVTRDWQPSTVRMNPASVWEYRHTNPRSRDIFFVTAARSMGIPSRIDLVTNKVQWADASGNWNDAIFDPSMMETVNPQGKLKLTYEKAGRIDDPKYYSHFSLSKIVDGEPQLLNYDEDASWSTILKDATSLDAGQYMLVTGQRMADGSVLARIQFFDIVPDKVTEGKLVLRQDDAEVQVLGNFNAENLYHDLATGTDKSIISTTGRGYYILGLLTPNHEPTNHALRDIAAYNDDFEKWGHKMVLLFKDSQDAQRFDASQLPALASTAVYGTDIDGAIAKEIAENMKLTSGDRPVFIVADTFNRVVFILQGYTIGLGEKLIDTIHKLKE